MTTEQNSAAARSGGKTGQDPHRSLHSEAGGLPGEHPGRSRSPVAKVAGLAWLEFEKPDLDRAGRFLADFGFTLTGTPGGTALKAPPKIAATLAGLLPPATRWRLFFKRQAANRRYLRDGDLITATIASPDGRLDLGTQRHTVIGKTP